MDERELADRPAEVTLSAPDPLADGYRPYRRYHLSLKDVNGETIAQQRDVLLGGKVVAVLPVDPVRNELVMLRQFRLAAHLANGRGELVEIVAGRVEPNETLIESARRECAEEIGVAPGALVELFSYLTTPGLTDEEVTIFLAAVDTSQIQEGARVTPDGERLHILRVSIDAAIAELSRGTMRNGPLLIALQWLALNRGRLSELLKAPR